MKRMFGTVALVLVAALLAAAGTAWLFITERINVKHLLYQLQYNPWVTAHNPVQETRTIQTVLLKLKVQVYSLPSMKTKKPFVSGGGAILPLGGGRILVLDKAGNLYRFRRTGDGPKLETLGNAVKTNDDLYRKYARAQGYRVRPGTNVGYAGLGMRAIDLLHLRKHGLIALSYTQWQPDRHCMVNKVSVRKVDKNLDFLPGSKWREVFVSHPCIGLNRKNKAKPMAGHQTGSRMFELPDGRFLLSIGDVKHDGAHRPNILDDPKVDLGKIFVVDPITKAREVFTTGHRNPQGLTIGRDGTIWETEHGPTGGDELNRLVKGENYGWPHVTLGRLCLTCKGILNGRHDGYFPPVFAWSPGLGISNLIEVRGIDPAWDGNLMVSSLKNQSLHRLTMYQGHVQQDEVIHIGERIRDLYQARNEDIVLWTDSGKIIFISAIRKRSKVEKMILALPPEARMAIRDCMECHIFEPGARQEGMLNLWGVYGRKMGSADYENYSDAMKAKGGVWDERSLDAFLKDPQGFIPDNAMGDNGIADDQVRSEVIDFLKRLH